MRGGFAAPALGARYSQVAYAGARMVAPSGGGLGGMGFDLGLCDGGYRGSLVIPELGAIGKAPRDRGGSAR